MGSKLTEGKVRHEPKSAGGPKPVGAPPSPRSRERLQIALVQSVTRYSPGGYVYVGGNPTDISWLPGNQSIVLQLGNQVRSFQHTDEMNNWISRQLAVRNERN